MRNNSLLVEVKGYSPAEPIGCRKHTSQLAIEATTIALALFRSFTSEPTESDSVGFPVGWWMHESSVNMTKYCFFQLYTVE
jgi:hypothetical protein